MDMNTTTAKAAPMGYIDSLKIPKTLTDAEVASLLRKTGEHRDGYRDHVIFAVALATGLREHEILALNVGDVFSPAGTARRRLRLRVFKRSNRDADAQEAFISDQLRVKLERLLANKRRDGESVEPDAPLFISRHGNRLSARMLRHAFGLWQARAGFERQLSFHALRHTAITRIYGATRDVLVAQRFARHASLRSTSIYMHASDQAMIAAVAALPC